jgi:hypothetical protein
MFPALEFYTGLEHIRGNDIQGDISKYEGEELIKSQPFTFKKIIICSENDIITNSPVINFIKIIKPFNIEELIDRIENG